MHWKMFWSFKTVGLWNCFKRPHQSLSTQWEENVSIPSDRPGISWSLLCKSHCIANFQGLLGFLNQITEAKSLTICIYLLSHLPSCWVHSLADGSTPGMRKSGCFFEELYKGTARLEHIGGSPSILHGEQLGSPFILLIYLLVPVENYVLEDEDGGKRM